MPATKPKSDDPDDIFADSRMSFGDHLDELRTRLFSALKGLLFFLIIGFALDGVGTYFGWPNFGVGRPVFKLMTQTVEDQVRDFYSKRNENTFQKLLPAIKRISAEDEARIAAILRANDDNIEALSAEDRRKWLGKAETITAIERISPEDDARITAILVENDYSIDVLSSEDRRKLLGKPETITAFLPVEQLEPSFGKPKDPGLTELKLELKIYPAQMTYLNLKGEVISKSKKYLTSLSVQEPFMVYFKVSLICGFILASPWIFYQVWAFVASGLYSHEKRHVYYYLPASLFLFLAGIALCQFFVLPSAVRALLGFNDFLDVDPDIRLNEWLSFAIILPLVFGLSFQTPLVMVFLNRIGMFSYKDYLTYWRAAMMILAVLSAVITPTPDVLTMMYLFVPMFGLYMLGIAICKYLPPSHEKYQDDDAEQVAV